MDKYHIRPFEKGYIIFAEKDGFIYDICETLEEAQNIIQELKDKNE